MIVLLLFLLGVWLWQNHFARPIRDDDPVRLATTWDLALRKVDRDLRLAEGSGHLPEWVRMALAIETREQVIDRAVATLAAINTGHHHAGDGPDPLATAARSRGAYALGVLLALQKGGDPAAAPFATLGLDQPPTENEATSRIIRGEEAVWDLAYLRSFGTPGIEQYTNLVHARSSALVGRTVIVRGLMVAVALGGLVFLPATLLAFARTRAKPRRPGYETRWTLSFGLAVFLLAYLASLGVSLTFNQFMDGLARRGAAPLPMPVFIAIDAAIRFIPALLAIGLLFRRCRHAVSRLGISGPLDGRLVLGGFAILMVIDFGLRMIPQTQGTPDTAGGLSTHDAGLWGLAFGLVSACLAAPVAEEILYRGVLFRSLANRLPLVPAAALSALVFALVHFYTLDSLILVAAVGFVCALVFASSRSLLTAIALHALYNASVKIPEWIVYHAPLT